MQSQTEQSNHHLESVDTPYQTGQKNKQKLNYGVVKNLTLHYKNNEGDSDNKVAYTNPTNHNEDISDQSIANRSPTVRQSRIMWPMGVRRADNLMGISYSGQIFNDKI